METCDAWLAGNSVDDVGDLFGGSVSFGATIQTVVALVISLLSLDGLRRLARTRIIAGALVDPRAAVVYRASSREIVRLAAGATTTQPAGNQLNQPFTQSPPGGGGGGAPINCGGINSIGSAPSSVLKPERGVDEELAYGHRFADDSQVQLTLYSVNVYDKLYSTTVPLSTVGTGFIDPAYLASVEARVAAKCGVPSAASLLGVSATVNVGRAQASRDPWRFETSPQAFEAAR